MRTFGNLALVGRTWVIGELEPHVRIRLKSVFPKVPKTAFPPYEFPADAATAADLEWFERRYRLQMSDADRAALEAGRTAYENAQAEARAIFSADYQPPMFAGLQPGQAVRRHQAQNVELLRRFGGVLVADDVGEGKTYTAGAACLTPGALPATIVVPPHLAVQWRRKLEEFTTLSCHVVTKTRPYELPPVDVRIFGFTQLAGWIDVLEMLGTGLAVFDEGHELRHGTETAKGKAARRLCEVSRMRMMMTATPVFNYGDEIWNVMAFVRPEVLGERWDFLREWCGGAEDSKGRRVMDPAALGTYLREQNAMTRKLGGGSAANRVVETIPHDHARLEGVEALAYSLAYTAVTGAFEERGQAVRELNLMLRHETGVAKAGFVAQYVRALVEASDEPLILFGWHRDVYDIWLAALKDLGCVMYTGSESPAEKNRAVQRFLAGEAKVFIMSLRSGAGVDGLQQVCRRAVFGELDWSPAMHDQCIGRLNREGQRIWDQDGLVDAIFLVAEDGSDPPIVDMLGIKSSQADGIVNPTVKPQREAADRAPIEKLIERYLGANGARVA